MENNNLLSLDYIKIKENISLILNDNNIGVSNLDIRKIQILMKTLENSCDNIINGIEFYKKDIRKHTSLNELLETALYNPLIQKHMKFITLLEGSNLIKNNNPNDILDSHTAIYNKINLNTYYKKLKFENSNSFSIIRNSAKESEIEYALSKINRIINNDFAFLPPIIKSKYTDDFILYKLYKPQSDDNFHNSISKINSKHNSTLISNYSDIKFFNVFKLIKNIKLSKERKLALEQYIIFEKKIEDEFSENISNLTLFRESFSFLKPILVDNSYLKLEDIIVNSFELQSWLKSIKLLLERYLNYTSIKNTIYNLNPLDSKLLLFCFENTSNFRTMSELLNFLPSYLTNKIVKEKLSHKEEYFQDNFFNSNLNTAYISFHNLKKLLSPYSNIFEVDTITPYNNLNNSCYSYRSIIEKKTTSLIKSLNYTYKRVYLSHTTYKLTLKNLENSNKSIDIYFTNNLHLDFNDLLNILNSKNSSKEILFISPNDFFNNEQATLRNIKKLFLEILK